MSWSPDDIKACSGPGTFQNFKNSEIGTRGGKRKLKRSVYRWKRRERKIWFEFHFASLNGIGQTLSTPRRVAVIKHATCLRLSGDGVVTGLECASPSDMRSRFVALAVRGLEIVRVLARSGYSNRSGMLGRTYMCHIEAELGQLRSSTANRGVKFGFEQTDDGIYCRRQFTLQAEKQTPLGSSTQESACIMRTLSIPRIETPCFPRFI